MSEMKRTPLTLELLEERNLLAGLVAAYAFSEGSGTSVADLSGNGNSGTISNATWTTAGKYGKALSFNGTNAWVTIQDKASLDLTTGMTLEAWVRPTASATYWTAVVAKEQPNDPNNDVGYALYAADGSGKPPAVHGLFGSGKGADQYASGGSKLTLNTWTHLAGTFDGSRLRLYVNGSLVATKNATRSSMTTTTGPLRIGGDFTKEYFTGQIDEVRVYNRALSQTEIQTDMATPLDTTGPSVVITSPANGATVSKTVSVSANATSGTNIASVQFKLDGANLGPVLTAAPYTYSWDTTKATYGSHVLTAVATDTAGKTATSAAVTVTVNNVAAPTVTITSPTVGATVANSVSVTANASSSLAIASVQFMVDGTNLGPALTAAPYTYSWDTTKINNGSHTLTAVATDTLGQATTSAGVTVTVSNVIPAPTVSITSPTNGDTVSATISVTASASSSIGIASVQFKLDGTNLGPALTAAPYTYSWDTTKFLNGNHTLTAVATDTSNQSTTSAAVTVTINNPVLPPTVVITNPTAGATIIGSVNVTVNAFSAAGIASVQYLLDGSNLGSAVTAAPYTYSWDTTTVANGNHVLSAIATDTIGQSTTSATVAVTLNNPVPPPVVSVTNPSPGDTVNSTINVTANATSSIGIASVQLKLDGANLGPALTTAPYTYSWDTTKFLNGSHTLTAVATDTSNQSTTSAGVTFTVSNTIAPPTVSILSPGNGATVSSTISITASAASPGAITSVQYKLDGVNLGPALTNSPYTYSWDTTKVGNGSHTLSAVATDTTGQTTTSDPVTVTVSNTAPAPTVSITSPANGATVANTVNLTASASSTVGIASVQFKLNGSNVGPALVTAPYTYALDTTKIVNGTYSLTAVATDTLGQATTSAAITLTIKNTVTNVTLTADGSQTFQTIDGFGANLSSYAWNGGNVTGVLDTLMNVQGDNLFRVIIETCTGWEDTFNPDPYTNNAVYATTKFTNLWNEISYLNAHGATVMLNVMGYLPSWLGPNSTVAPGNEDAWADMVASMVYYGVNTAKVKIDYLSPMNEEDVGYPEGISADQFQFTNLTDRLLAKLAAHGLPNFPIVGPDVANVTNLTTKYLPQMFGDSTLMGHVNHLVYHSYTGDSTNVDSTVKKSGWPGRDWWVTEFAGGLVPGGDTGTPVSDEWGYSKLGFQYLLNHLSAGASGAAVYDGVDAYYEHHGGVNSLGQVGWNQTTNTYTIRKRLYALGQVFKFVTPGMVRVGASDSSSSVIEVAFKDPASGKVAIVGQNTSSGLVTITGTLTGGLSAASFQVYFTNANSGVNMQQQANLTVSGGTFAFNVPADTIFTLVTGSGAAGGASLTPLAVLEDPVSVSSDLINGSNVSPVSALPVSVSSGRPWELAIALGGTSPSPTPNRRGEDLAFPESGWSGWGRDARALDAIFSGSGAQVAMEKNDLIFAASRDELKRGDDLFGFADGRRLFGSRPGSGDLA
jgi:hypothetical protein